MNYQEIIENNVRRFHCEWPKYAFHMAGIDNVISILTAGQLLSRNRAKELGVMSIDNASKGVIDHTDEQVKKYVRFYFRPQTPTYFYFEGYHQKGLRYDNDDSVNMPVPVLLLFDLEMLLNNDKTCFNGVRASGKKYAPQRGVNAFSNLEFDRIYSRGATDTETIREYRHAEILYPDCCLIENMLMKIVCRTELEAVTLKTELKNRNKKAFSKWNEKITYDNSMFSESGLRLQYISQKKEALEQEVRPICFKITGYDDYYSYIRRYAMRSSELQNYPELTVVFDVRFDNNPYHHLFTGHVNLRRSDVATAVDNIPRDSGNMHIKVYFDEEKNLMFSGRIPIDIKCRKFKLILDTSEVMPPFPAASYKDAYIDVPEL